MLGPGWTVEELCETSLELLHLHLHLWQLCVKVLVHICLEVQVPGIDTVRCDDVTLLLQLLVHQVQLGQLSWKVKTFKEDGDLLPLAGEQAGVVVMPLGQVGLSGQEPDRVELLPEKNVPPQRDA